MTLTGLPLILLACAATVSACATTVLLWPRLAGRWFPVRAAGILLTETLLVFSVGLVVNRHDGFYPSWQALGGNTGTRTELREAAPGRLDARLAAAGAGAVWRPAELARWKLATPPRIVVSADYATLPRDEFPVVLALVPAAGPAVARARRLTGTVTVVTVPGPGTTATALRDLPGVLRRDVRVSTTGWDVVATGPQAALGAALIDAEPPGFAAAVGWAAADQLSAPLAAPQRLP